MLDRVIDRYKDETLMVKICFNRSESEMLKKLEEEHEELNLSLSALTTHFAQVRCCLAATCRIFDGLF